MGFGRSEQKDGAQKDGAVSGVRTIVGQVVWLVCVVAALFLAVGALLVALEANTSNDLVALVLDGAEVADLEVFSRDNGILKFTGEQAAVRNALFNWGLGAVAWLVVGTLLERVARPQR